jgi:hypothetical protein
MMTRNAMAALEAAFGNEFQEIDIGSRLYEHYS